jgi:hypothetical protein
VCARHSAGLSLPDIVHSDAPAQDRILSLKDAHIRQAAAVVRETSQPELEYDVAFMLIFFIFILKNPKIRLFFFS